MSPFLFLVQKFTFKLNETGQSFLSYLSTYTHRISRTELGNVWLLIISYQEETIFTRQEVSRNVDIRKHVGGSRSVAPSGLIQASQRWLQRFPCSHRSPIRDNKTWPQQLVALTEKMQSIKFWNHSAARYFPLWTFSGKHFLPEVDWLMARGDWQGQ